MFETAAENAVRFVREAQLPSLAEPIEGLEGAQSPESPLDQAKDQATVVGSDIISFVSGVTAEQRQDLINSALLAQLVAKVQVPDASRIYDWYNAYFAVLKQIGWIVQDQQFATYRASSLGFAAHDAIIGLATTLLGPSPAALAVVKATLDALKNTGENSRWLTIFNRESQSGETARFQITVAEPDGAGRFLVKLMAFGLEAHATLTQVLFFKLNASDDVLRHFSGSVSINSDVLAAVREDIKTRLVVHVQAYVRNLPDLNVPSLDNPPPPPDRLESMSPLAGRLLDGVTDNDVRDAASFREEPPADLESAARPVGTPFPTDWQSVISLTAYQFIVRWETGGQAYYERVLKGHPEWPGYASGITIGCGWDLGYHTVGQFQEQWGTRLNSADFARLTPYIGFCTVEPDRAAKVALAKDLVKNHLSDITVPWATAIEQFDNVKYPDLIHQLYNAVSNLDRIGPSCRGALLSLAFNRGAAFSKAGERFAEMRAVGDAMRSGTLQDFARIPDLIRSMKRIWGLNSSLAKRREGEAQLFEAGLNEMRLAAQADAHARPGHAAGAPAGHEESAPRTETLTDIAAPQTDVADEDETTAIFADEHLESAGLTVASVKWNPKDDEQPDYRHLDTSLAGTTFDLTADDLEALIAANEFAPISARIAFALRGASLGVDKRENMSFVTITDQRPDHRQFRCVIGVYDRPSKMLWAYRASTVPNAAYVFKCYRMAQAGTPVADLIGNILPTGCYTYTVGTHHPGTSREIPTVLRLARSASDASPAVVLRSLNDTVYDRFDRFVTATPADNVHPGQMTNGFSSAGCLTLPGFYKNGQHTGLWANFRAALGLGPASNGQQYSLMLLTGLDAALACAVRTSHGSVARITRLRHGSTGPRVAALQAALRVQGDPQLGPVTRQALVKRQVEMLGWSDAIYSPAMDDLLHLSIYPTS